MIASKFYDDKIRTTKLGKKKAALFAFFNQMPKGGDLHHHYSGSVYAETYVNYVVYKNYFININTLDVRESLDDIKVLNKNEWKQFKDFNDYELADLKANLIREWSIKDFDHNQGSSADHFFSTFPDFKIASSATKKAGLQEIKKRAIQQRLRYIETLFYRINIKSIKIDNRDISLKKYQEKNNTTKVFEILNQIYEDINEDIKEIATKHNKEIDSLHKKAVPDSEELIIRYQNYCLRVKQPTDLFVELLACFYSANSSELVVGVNIVGPEHNDVSMRDYWLHMQFYSFLKDKFPNVKCSLHAGELSLGLVKPEDLGKHIKQAIDIAKADRIGHGLDIIHDVDFLETIDKLKSKKIPVEINLTSNEFILKVSHDLHPIEVYHNYEVPMIISTDDEGVLRSSITEQYVLLAKRYDLTYEHIKSLVFNSIRFSFINDENLKSKLITQLESDFLEFENKFPELDKLFNQIE